MFVKFELFHALQYSWDIIPSISVCFFSIMKSVMIKPWIDFNLIYLFQQIWARPALQYAISVT